MRLHACTLMLMFTAAQSGAQTLSHEYRQLVKEAYALYQAGEYLKSGEQYTAAFRANQWKGHSSDRYNAACTWTQAGVYDSAFFQLERIVNMAAYADLEQISGDSSLSGLHSDLRWPALLEAVRVNKERTEARLDKMLAEQLDSVYNDDQQYRKQLADIASRYGRESKEMKELLALMYRADSLNLIKVRAILDQQGWVGPEEVGSRGNMALFLVIQHADQQVQEHYLPMMRLAVKNGNAKAADLALLEDRVALRQGRKQMYGSQIGMNPVTGKTYVRMLEDPGNVDRRRAEAGLEKLEDYLKNWDMTWDPEQYIRDLPAIEAMDRLK